MFTRKTSHRASNGFSLVELLLVLTLAPIVFFAVYSNFTSGVGLWRRMQVDTPEEDSAIFVTNAQRDFGNMMRFAAIPFEGEHEEVLFACGIDAAKEVGGSRAIGRLRFFYDPSAHGIMREAQDYSQAHEDKPGRISRVLGGVASFEVFYLVLEPLSAEYEWRPSFEPRTGESSLPVAVRITYALDRSGRMSTHTFFVPVGGIVK